MPKKKRGRPPGSKERPVEARIVEVPPACPLCNSDKIRVIPGSGVRVIEHAYEHPVHGMVSRLEKRRMQCGDCQRVFIKDTLRLAEDQKQ